MVACVHRTRESLIRRDEWLQTIDADILTYFELRERDLLLSSLYDR